MCGICGAVSTSAHQDQKQQVERIREGIQHRGPDDAGIFHDQRATLGFRRLAILDLSPAGHQPMANEDGTIWLIFNGEVYNYQELRRQLQQRGHQFRSQTDSEVIIHGYEEYGVDILTKLRGMFALALWDQKRGRLLLARDRLGKKPLMYTEKSGTLFFASEIQPLVDVIGRPEWDWLSLQYYFRLRSIPSPRTMYQGVHKLRAGHYLLWENGKVTTQPYWQVSLTPKTQLSLQEAGEEFERLLRESVELRLMSDVPLGAFLSGGLDSAVIVGLMAQASPQPVKTFSIGFAEAKYDELPLARLVSKKFSTDHHETVIEPNVIEVLPQLLRHFGEPFADSSAVAMYYVAKFAREHVTVALTGDGGDENLAGYEHNAFLTNWQRYNHGPLALRQALVGISSPFRRWLPSMLQYRLDTASQLWTENLPSQYADLLFGFSRRDTAQLLKAVEDDHNPDNWLASLLTDQERQLDLVDQLTALDLRFYLPEQLMKKTDNATMAVSLEARSPFLDHELIDFSTKLPSSYKVRGDVRKFLLRQQFSSMLPPELLTAPKHGFDMPVDTWLRGPLLPHLRERLADDTFQALPLNHQMISRLVEDHAQRRGHHGIRLWSLLCLAEWMQT